jgi:hypothetical protein
MDEKSESATRSASIRWNNATALRPHSNRNATVMRIDAIKVKESKVKESKAKSDFSPGGEFEGMVF